MIPGTIHSNSIDAAQDIRAAAAEGSPLQVTISFPQKPEPSSSHYRCVFTNAYKMKEEFGKFLDTIFLQLDKDKFFALMDKILSDPDKTDEQVYNELVEKVASTKKKFAFLHQLRSLAVLKKGMGEQAKELLKNYDGKKIDSYMEIYDRRYVNSIKGAAKLSLKGDIIAVCDTPKVDFGARIQAGSLFFRYPYTKYVSLNDADCQNPLLEPEKTAKPITSEEVAPNSVDLAVVVGGGHHWTKERAKAFLISVIQAMAPGAGLLIRDHSLLTSSVLTHDEMVALVSVVHSLVNAVAGAKWEEEFAELRNFFTREELVALLRECGAEPESQKALVLKDDPTENAMMLFVKQPRTLDELLHASGYRNGKRPKEGTRATWIEWGNVRFSKTYAEFIQNHPSYAFDWRGHLKQHWQHFYYFVRESAKDPEVPLKNLLISDNIAMNLFILTAATIECSKNWVLSLPQALYARVKYGEKWREVRDLSGLDRFYAANEKAYSEFIEHTPFYMYNPKIKEMWKAIWGSSDSMGVKLFSSFSASIATIGFLLNKGISAPIRWFYTSEANVEPDTINILIKDPHNELNVVMSRWDTKTHSSGQIKVIYSTTDGYKFVSLPRYKPFTEICGYFSETESLEIIEVGSQKEISVDVLMPSGTQVAALEGASLIYEMDKLQDPEKRHYLTYQVKLTVLPHFLQLAGLRNITYIHE